MNVADLELGPNSFTFLSPANDSTSWLDHIITSRSDLINNIDILHHLCIFDHFPLRFDLKFEIPSIEVEMDDDDSGEFFKWENFNLFRNEVHDIMNEKFGENILGNPVFCCENNPCNDPGHKRIIDTLSDYLIESLLESTRILSTQITIRFKPVPGWNTICKENYAIARNCFLQWKESGMSRDGPEYNSMKESRAEFRSALRYCRENENYIRESQTINSFHNKEFKTFWRQVCVRNNLQYKTVDGVSDKDMVPELFAEKFFRVLDDKSCRKKPCSFDWKFAESQNNPKGAQNFLFKNIKENILKLNPASDLDEIHTNHLKFATENTILFITFLFNSILSHSHLPKRFLRGKIRPEIKNKLGNKSDSDNFRPVMISSNFLKLFEYCIQPFLVRALKIHDNQFGFREGTSTQMTIALVKEIIDQYNYNKSNVYACFLDLSKGFDKVNHFKLLDKIWDTNLSTNLKLIMKEFFLNQDAYVSYNNSNSQVRHIANGVRQGGVNSPLLFNFYLYSMIKDISVTTMGCKIGLNSFSVIAYADDLVALAPSQSALQVLINKINYNLNLLDLTVNPSKTKVIVFGKDKNWYRENNPEFYIADKKLDIVQNLEYLGVILTMSLNNSMDVQRLARAFLRQAFACLHKFGNYPVNIKIFLFRVYCTSLYGSELWTDLKGCSKNFSSLKINFHKFIKRILGLPIRSSNHNACIDAEMMTFEHIRNAKMFHFAFQLKHSKSPCFKRIKNFFTERSIFMKKVNKTASETYSIASVLENDRAAVNARINYVFLREPRYEGYHSSNMGSNTA